MFMLLCKKLMGLQRKGPSSPASGAVYVSACESHEVMAAQVLSQHDLWKRLLTHCKEQGALVEGPLNNLKPSYMQLSRPSKVARLVPLLFFFVYGWTDGNFSSSSYSFWLSVYELQ